MLVLAAVGGLLFSTWTTLPVGAQALVLAVVAGAVTASAMMTEQRTSKTASNRVASTMYGAAGACVAAAVTLTVIAIEPSAGRLSVAAGGLAAASYGLWVWSRQPGSALRSLLTMGALVYAAGPSGMQLGDRYSTQDIETWAGAILGLFEPDHVSDALLLPAAGWMVAGVVGLWLASRSTGRSRSAVTTTATAVLLGAAAMVNIASSGLGSFAALTIVLAYLVYGLVGDRPGVLVAGILGTLVAGVRVLLALFSGQVAVTIATLGAGCVCLVWAARAVRDRHTTSQDDIPDETLGGVATDV